MTIEVVRETAQTSANALRRLSALRLLLGHPGAAISLAVIVLWCVIGLTIELWAPYDPLAPSGDRLQPPGTAHWLGTDALGRDVFTRTMYGVRYSLPVALLVIGVVVLIGSAIGLLAGYFGGWTDYILMRITDITAAFPPLILAMCVVAVLGPGIVNSAIALIAVWWPLTARLLRAEVLSVKESDHVMAARVNSASDLRIMFRHILPLCWAPVLINSTVDVGIIAISLAGLSFIGLGSPPPTPEWGLMIYEGAGRYFNWWIAAGPGLAIASVALAFNFLGDGIQRTLDPRKDK